MGIITMALLSGGYITTFEVPLWVMSACALMMGLGTATGGWKVIKTLGLKLSKIQPVHGFAAESAASAVLLTAANLGAPVSTTHVITTCIMGVGSTRQVGYRKEDRVCVGVYPARMWYNGRDNLRGAESYYRRIAREFYVHNPGKRPCKEL
jgi:phosphate/sulfate permease